MAIDYRRLAIEVESPEQLGYERIRSNLAESSVADMRLDDLDLALDELVLMYGDHAGHPGLRALVAADGDGLSEDDVLLLPGAAAALFIVATTLLGPRSRVIVARPNYATNLETPRAIGADVAMLDLQHEDGWRVDPDRLREPADTRHPTGQPDQPAQPDRPGHRRADDARDRRHGRGAPAGAPAGR